MKKNRVMSMICILSLTMAVNVSAVPKTEMESYERDGMMYIEKTYTIGAEEDISDVADGSFDLNGYSYHQIDMKSEPVVVTEEKTVEELKKASVSSQGMAQIIEKIGETIEYADEDGFHGELKPDPESVKYYTSGYSSKTMTKTGSQMYYNLSSMDTSQIPKMIWRDGIGLKLTDIQWIGDNHLASADTAVGNNYAAKGFYTGTYQVNMPSGYIAEVLYKGTVEKEISEQTAYTVTYVGEEIEPEGIFDTMSVPIIVGILLFGTAAVAGGIYLYRKLKKDQEEEIIDDLEKDEEADTDET